MAFVALEDLSDCSSEHQRALPDALGAVLLPHHRVMLVAVSFDRKTRRGDEPSSNKSADECRRPAPPLPLPTLGIAGHLRASYVRREEEHWTLWESTESRRARAGGAAASCTQIGVAVGVP
jgi:hypothetical protein